MNFAPRTFPAGGLVYGVILNDRESYERMGPALAEPPYMGAPRAPAMFVKPYNTQVGDGSTVRLPTGATALAIGGQLGLAVGRSVSRLEPATALASLAGYLPVIDLSIPHANVYRPAIREKCFDGACPMGARLTPVAAVADPAQLTIRTFINGRLAAERRLDDLLRPLPRLLADVTEFMTLLPGDVLLAGAPLELPLAVAGDRVAVEISGVGRVECLITGGGA